MAINLLIQKENNGCYVNANTYGKVLCEYISAVIFKVKHGWTSFSNNGAC